MLVPVTPDWHIGNPQAGPRQPDLEPPPGRLTMTAAASVEPPDAYVEVAAEEDVRHAVRRSLRELGITYQELEQQAHRGRFQSNRARLVWMAIRDVGQD